MEGHIYVMALSIVSLISLYLSGISWRKNEINGARWLAVLMAAIGLWTTMQIASAVSADMGDKLFFHNLMYIGISLIPLSVFYFVLDYYHLLKPLSSSIKISMGVIPALTICVVASDSYHHLFYRSVKLQEFGSFALVSGTFNMWFWVHSTYSYLLIVGTLLVLGYQLRSESGHYRRQSMQLIGAILASSLINLLTITHTIDVRIDLTPFTFILVGTIFYYSLFYTRVFEIGPITKELLYDNIHEALLILDAGKSITEHNKAFLNLFDEIPEKIVGRSAVDLFNDLGYPGDQMMSTLDCGSRLLTEKNHHPRSWQITRSALKGRSGTPSGYLYLFKDVTETDQSLLAADQALKAAEYARESITRNLSDMSHEIRTPLMGILGAAHQLKADACDAEQTTDANEILKGSETLLGTVNRVLDYSKLEAGKMHTHDEAFRCAEYLQDLRRGDQPKVRLKYNPPSLDGTTLRGNRQHLTQLMHLILDFLKESGTEDVDLSLDYDGTRLFHQLRFEVPEPASQELMMKWGHASDYLMTSWHPDPLMVVLADRLAHFMEAPLTISPQGEGWIIAFRLKLDTVDSAPIPAESPAISNAETPYKLLFAEDSVINQAVLKRMLKALPWDITFASNGLQAMELAETTLFDGIFTDIHMPGLGGIELSYSLQETINRDTPVFALTSDVDVDLQKAVEESPIRTLLVKPCPKERLIQVLQDNPKQVCKDDE